MAQGNRRDEKMRSDRGEWDRKRTGFGNTDKRKKNRRSRPSGRERRAVKKYRLIRSGVLLLFLLTVVLLLRSCIRKVRGTDSMSFDYGTVNVDASEPVIDVQLLDVNPYSRPGTTIDEIQLAEDEEMIDFGSEPYVEDYKIQTSEERCVIPDIDILQRELEKMQAELGLTDIVSEEVDLDNLENSEDNSQQTKFYSNVESDSNLAEGKVEEVEEKEEDENSSALEADLTTEDDESKSANNQVISATKTTDEVDEKTQDELLEEVGMSHDTQEEPEQELEPNVQEQGTDDFEDEYLDSDILKSIEVIEEDIPSDDEEDEDISSNDNDDEEDDYDLSSDEEDDSDDISSVYEDDGDDSEDISDSEEDEEDDEDEDSYDFNESDDDEDSYDFSESDDNEDDDISSDESDDQPVEESVVYEDEYLDSDIYSNIKILKKVKKKKQGVSEVSSSSSARQTTKSKKSSSTLGVETKKARDSRNVNDSSKSSGSLSKASKEVPKGAPSLERVATQPEKSEFGGRDEEPKDLRSFLRKHPHCEMSVVYKYFTKKEVQNALLTGKVIKKGTQLHI